MKEVEVKILEVNRRNIEVALIGLGAKKIFDGDIQTLFLDFEDCRIAKEKNLLRLRKDEDKAELTFKKVHVTESVKVAEEYSVEVSSLETTLRILENLGLLVTESMRKRRVSYVLDDARFDFDLYLGGYAYIPEFMEIEAKNEELVHKYAELLGFNAKDCLPWSTNDLIRYYAVEKGKVEK
jgi:predicted adenylyl cyclase CyaB